MKKNVIALVVAAAMLLFACSPAESAPAPKVDWSKPAKTLDELENQVIAWQIEYNKVSNNETWTAETLQNSLSLNLERGLIVAKGFVSLKDSWDNDFSATAKKEKFPVLYLLENGLVDKRTPGMNWIDPFGAPIGYELDVPAPPNKFDPLPQSYQLTLNVDSTNWHLLPKQVEATLTRSVAHRNNSDFGSFMSKDLSPRETKKLEATLLGTWADFVVRNNPEIDRETLKTDVGLNDEIFHQGHFSVDHQIVFVADHPSTELRKAFSGLTTKSQSFW